MRKVFNKFGRIYSKIIRSNKFLIVLSAIIGILAWVYIINVNGSSRETVVEIPVKIDIAGTTPEKNSLSLYNNELSYSVKVTITGPRSKIYTFSKDKLYASTDVSEITTAGPKDVPIKVQCTDKELEIKSTSPEKIRLYFDNEITKKIPVTLAATGTLPDGYEIKNKEISPAEIEITGPATIVNEIATVALPVDINGQKATNLKNTSDLLLLTSTNEKIDKTYLKISSEQATYSINIVYSKIVQIKPALKSKNGGDESSYIIATCEPNVIRIEGDEVQISNVEYVLTGEIITEEMVGSEQNFTVELPKQTQFTSDVKFVTVNLKLDSGAKTKDFTFNSKLMNNISFINTPEGKTPKIKTSSFTVPIRSLDFLLDTITANDIKLSVDLSAPEADGSYKVNFKIPNIPFGVLKDIFINVDLT